MRGLMRAAWALATIVLFVAPASADTPVIDDLSPSQATVGGGDFTLTVNGSNFTPASVVRWDGSDRTTVFVSANQLRASIPASDIAVLGTASITVMTPDEDPSNSVMFPVTADPVPFINALTPSRATAGSPAFTLNVSGTNFTTSSLVRWNGVTRATSFFSSLTLEASIPASDIAKAGTADVTVIEPAGPTSNTLTFTTTVQTPAPSIGSLNPDSAVAGGPAFTLTVNGTNFSETSVIRWNGAARDTVFLSNARLSATIPARDIAQVGSASVTVDETAPGGEVSAPVTFVITPFATFYFAQVVVGGGFSTVFTLVNTGIGTASGNLILTDDEGNPFSVDLTEANSASEAPGDRHAFVGSVFPVTVPSGTTRVITARALDSNAPARRGWGRVQSDGGSLHGVATFKFREGEALQSIAGVLGSGMVECASIPVDNSEAESRFIGFALANINAGPIEVQVLVLDENGSVIDVINPDELNPLAGGSQIARFLHEYVPNRATFQGTMVLRSDPVKSFAIVALVLEEGLLSAIPVVPEKPPGLTP